MTRASKTAGVTQTHAHGRKERSEFGREVQGNDECGAAVASTGHAARWPSSTVSEITVADKTVCALATLCTDAHRGRPRSIIPAWTMDRDSVCVRARMRESVTTRCRTNEEREQHAQHKFTWICSHTSTPSGEVSASGSQCNCGNMATLSETLTAIHAQLLQPQGSHTKRAPSELGWPSSVVVGVIKANVVRAESIALLSRHGCAWRSTHCLDEYPVRRLFIMIVRQSRAVFVPKGCGARHLTPSCAKANMMKPVSQFTYRSNSFAFLRPQPTHRFRVASVTIKIRDAPCNHRPFMLFAETSGI